MQMLWQKMPPVTASRYQEHVECTVVLHGKLISLVVVTKSMIWLSVL